MTWYEIIGLVIGALGGTAGLVGLYKAKAEKTTIDVGNMQSMLDESHKMYDEARKREEEIQQDFKSYKSDIAKYITEFKDRFSKLEIRLDKTEGEVFRLKGAVYQGYRCKFPQKIEDCPVLKKYEADHCEGCPATQDE